MKDVNRGHKNDSFHKNLLKQTIVSYKTYSQVYIDIDLPLSLLLLLDTTEKYIPQLNNGISKKLNID